MATRMQQRRGTAAQWTSANPILATAEIGFESDTGKFKIGDGVNHWADLTYFVDGAAIADLVDGAPELLNTLNEIAAAIGDDPDFINTMASKTWVGTAIDNHSSVSTDVHGIADTAELATKTYADDAANDAKDLAIQQSSDDLTIHISDTTNIHGIADTSLLVTQSQMSSDISQHSLVSTNVHGIADTAELATKSYTNDAISTHQSDTTNIHGISDTSALATKTYADNAVSTHEADTTNIHGIADTSALATKTYADGKASDAQSAAATALSDHEADTTNIHGIADTSALATKTYADSAVSTHNSNTSTAHGVTGAVVGTTNTQTLTNKTLTSPVINSPTGIVKADVGLGNVDNTSDANKPVSTAQQTALDLKADKASPTFTGTVNAANVTLSGNLTVNGTTTTVSSTNLEITDPLIYIGTGNSANANDLGVVGHFDNGTYQHTGIVRDATDGKWKLFSGVSTEPSGTIDFSSYTKDSLVLGTLEADSATIGNVSNTELQYLDGVTSAIQTQLNAKAPLASPTFTGTVTLPTGTVTSDMILDGTIVNADINASAAIATSKISGLDSALAAKAPLASPTFTGLVTVSSSGVAFTDGTQTAEGVPSRTPIVQKTASYTLSALTERDSLIEISSASAVTLTVPANSSVAYPVGTSIDILQTGAGQITVAGAGGVTVNATPGLKLRTQWSGATLFKRATDTWVLYGDLTA